MEFAVDCQFETTHHVVFANPARSSTAQIDQQSDVGHCEEGEHCCIDHVHASISPRSGLDSYAAEFQVGNRTFRLFARGAGSTLEAKSETAVLPISIRVPIADLERAKQIAERTGVGYQAVLKQAIRDGLKKAG